MTISAVVAKEARATETAATGTTGAATMSDARIPDPLLKRGPQSRK